MISNTDFMEQLNRYYFVWRKYNYVYETWAKAHGMSANSLLVLYAIHESRKDCTQKKISQGWMIPKQTINMILKEFERKGLVELLPMQEDKRNKLIQFTPTGNEYADDIVSKLRKVELYVIEKMGLKRMKQLNDNMALFSELFSEAGGEGRNEKDE